MAPECLRRTQLSEVGWQSIYSTLEELRRRMLRLRTSDWSVARWNRHGLPFGGRVVRIRRQRTLACNFELSWQQTHPHTHKHTRRQTNPQTGPITIHCAAKLSAQCNFWLQLRFDFDATPVRLLNKCR